MINNEIKNAYYQKKKAAVIVKQRKTEKKCKTLKKSPIKKLYTMEINKSIERIAEGKLSEMGLFELSIHAVMPLDVYHELKRRIELIRNHLNINLKTAKLKVIKSSQTAALEIVNSLLKNQQQ